MAAPSSIALRPGECGICDFTNTAHAETDLAVEQKDEENESGIAPPVIFNPPHRIGRASAIPSARTERTPNQALNHLNYPYASTF
jgi:hypothetical protein